MGGLWERVGRKAKRLSSAIAPIGARRGKGEAAKQTDACVQTSLQMTEVNKLCFIKWEQTESEF